MPGLAMTDFNRAMIYVRDVDRSLRFYRDLLGFEVLETGPGYARIKSPESPSTIALHAIGRDQIVDPKKEGVRLYFEVRNLDDVCDRLAEKGVPFTQMPKDMEWGWRHAYLSDPDGHALSLYWAGKRRLEKAQ